MKNTLLLAAALTGSVFASTPANAASLLINGSFEDLGGATLNSCGGVGCGYTYGSLIPGWSNGVGVVSGQFQPGDFTGGIVLTSMPDGLTGAYINGGGTLSQSAGTVTAAGTLYNFSVYFGLRNDADIATQILGQASLNIGSNSYAVAGTSPSYGDWAKYSVSYVSTSADIGKSIGVTLIGQSNGSAYQSLFDNAQLDASAVPEPATWLMMIVGFGAVGASVRRRRSQSVRVTYA